jgi:putative SbcD/Mre11-related phosphoesterase
MSLCGPRRKPGLPMLDGWQFTPEGAAVHRVEQTAVIADLHLGYEWARGASGDCVVAHSLQETLARLATLLGRCALSQLIVAGDLIETARPCPDTARDLDRLRNWLAERHVRLLVLEGNHDVSLSLSARSASSPPNRLPETCVVAGWTIGHGHRPIPGAQTISGHHHPIFRYGEIAAPCFLVGPARIILPAFSANAAGCNVVSSPRAKGWLDGSLRCLVSTGDDVLDFGPLSRLRRRLREGAP